MPDIGSLEPSLFAVKRGRKWVFRAVCPPRRNVRHCYHAGRARQGILRRVTITQIDVWATLHFREAGTTLPTPLRSISLIELDIAQPAGFFGAFQPAAQAALGRSLGTLFFLGLLFLGPLGTLEGQADLPLVAVHAQDLDIDLLPDL